MTVNGFSVAGLFFGDHLALARRCIGSIVTRTDPTLIRSVRVLLNAVSPVVRDCVFKYLRDLPAEVEVLVYESTVNRLKYPMMRKVLYDRKHPITTQYFMWFDDDSCLAPETDPGWWAKIYARMQSADIIGKLYTIRIAGKQAEGIEHQPWYADVAIHPARHRFRFATGGWWCARTSLLQKWDYPFPDIVHNGGDTMLGELTRQQQLRLVNFPDGVWINADMTGQSGTAPRRGDSKRPVWYSYESGVRHREHHQFEIEPFDPRITERR